MKPIAIITTIVALLAPTGSLAYDNSQLNAINEGRPLYLPYEVACSDSAVGEALYSGPLIGRDNKERAFNFFLQTGPGRPNFTQQQAAGIVGNLVRESGVNPAAPNPAAGVDKGGGIAQWEGQRFLSTNPNVGLKAYAAKYGKPWQDLQIQLEFLWHELTGTEKAAWTALKAANTVEEAAVAFEDKFERPRENHHAQSIEYAKQILDKYGDVPPPIGGVGSNTGTPGGNACSPAGAIGGTAAIQAMIKTGTDYAWPTPDCVQPGRPNCAAPKPNYRTDMVNPGGNDPFTDCGTFVATVMRKSGVDPNYPRVGTSVQKPYLMAHPEKYKITPNPKEGQLQPGDILIYSIGDKGHTMIYLGPKSTYPRVDAAWHAHSPHMNNHGGIVEILDKPGVIAATPL